MALGLLASLLCISCKDRSSQPAIQPPETKAPTQEINPEDLLPFQYSIQALNLPGNFMSRIKVSAEEVHVSILNDSEIIHSSTIPLDRAELRQALTKLTKGDLIPPETLNAAPPAKGLTESLETPLGKWTFHRDHQEPDQLLPQSAAHFLPLSNLATSWLEIATQEYRETFIALATKEQKIIHKVGDFIEIGMTRETLLKRFPDPDWEINNMINYEDWSPAVVSNATRKGTFAITIRLKDGKITSWSWSST